MVTDMVTDKTSPLSVSSNSHEPPFGGNTGEEQYKTEGVSYKVSTKTKRKRCLLQQSTVPSTLYIT